MEMTVGRLIELLEKCPKECPVAMYYDGAPRLEPNFAFLVKAEWGSWKEDRPQFQELVVLAQKDDVYNIDGGKLHGQPVTELFDASAQEEEKT